MDFQNWILEKGPSSDRGKTTKDKTGHIHTWSIKRITGDGATNKVKGHSHKIRKFIVIESDGHIHKLGELIK